MVAQRPSDAPTSLAAPQVLEASDARVERLLGVGEHGASYAASADAAGHVEVWHLREGVLDVTVGRRVAALRAVDHPALLPILAVRGDGGEPCLVVAGGFRWEDDAAWPTDGAALRRQAAELFAALASAHQLGIVHGALGPSQIGWRDGRPVLDLTALEVRAPKRAAQRAPECAAGPATGAADVWALATVLAAAPGGDALPLASLRAEDPEARPSARVAATLLAISSPPSVRPQRVTASLIDGVPRRLGAYRLLQAIGAGAMGRVFRAEDAIAAGEVAIKVLLPELASNPELVARFQREARVLARLQSPYVARFVAANEDQGFHYLVMEFVRGTSAGALTQARTRLDPDTALSIACDVARALSEVHALGLVHRDVKPSNILCEMDGEALLRVKLCDFGIARAVTPDEADQLTREGAPGTPAYMSPEQVENRPVDARSDVYALGATVFALIAGRAPFTGPAHLVSVAQVTEPPPLLRDLEPSVPPRVADVIMRCLAKDPADRYPDAAALHDALHAAWRGEATEEDALPQSIGLRGEPRVYDFRWVLRATPEELWPHVSNTQRVNRAAGLDDVEWSHHVEDGAVRIEGSFRAAGLELRWKENPFEWVAPRRLGVVREYVGGPFEWLRSTVEMTGLPGGGTELRHRVELMPRGLLGRLAGAVEVGLRLRRALERVYRHIDSAALVTRGRTPSAAPPDPFEGPASIGGGLQERVEARVARMVASGADPHVAQAIGADVCSAPSPTLARIRPRAWARERGFDEAIAIDALLLAASHGLLEMLWDLICPTCRVPSSIADSLRALATHGRCDACNLDYELDMARSVELVFRVHPTMRAADVGVYCIGGPAHSPHVLAQLRLPAGASFVLDVQLEPGRYAIVGRGLPHAWSFAVSPEAPLRRWDLALARGVRADGPLTLAPGEQQIVLVNDLEEEVLVRLERAGDRTDAVTAADAACSATFRELFPDEVLAPDRLVAISNVTLLFAQVADALVRYEVDEAQVHQELIALASHVHDAAAREGGAVVRLQGDGVMAVFSDRLAAVRAALALCRATPSAGVALHAGPARMTTIGGRLDYFGRTLHVAEQMGRFAGPGELLVGEPVLIEPASAPLLRAATRPAGVLRVGSTLVGRMRLSDAT